MAMILSWFAAPGIADTILSLLPTIVAILRIWRITQPIIEALEEAGLIRKNAIGLALKGLVFPQQLSPEELERFQASRLSNVGEGGGA
jgi:hypothetical protein